MQVRITNVTDGVGRKPVEVRIYTKRLRPGAFMDVPIQFIDEKVRKLEQVGAIVIGKLPPWYLDYENRRKVRNLTAEEVIANVEHKKHRQRALQARQAARADTPLEAPPSSEVVVKAAAEPAKQDVFASVEPAPLPLPDADEKVEKKEEKDDAKEDSRRIRPPRR